ncbi:hypothetical protein [Kitasatospora sp. NPDC094011]|uniref:hypothetical protein n=1 Tax=Kitasatospora sp. NPDC094011 TaxID=3364090 RepID=UPI003816D42F
MVSSAALWTLLHPQLTAAPPWCPTTCWTDAFCHLNCKDCTGRWWVYAYGCDVLPRTTCCGGTCVDLSSDPDNCGS